MTKTILYARVSTSEQTISHQETQAREAGFAIDRVISDRGVSGVRVPLRDRPEGKRLFDILRSGDTLVVRWVDRLGRDYKDVTDNIREFMRAGVKVCTVINRLTFDGATTDPMQMAVRDALIGFMAATAQAQAEASKEAMEAGRAKAKADGENREGGKAYKGRKPKFGKVAVETVQRMVLEGAGVGTIAKEVNLSRQAVYRIMASPETAFKTAASWGL